MHTQPRHTTTTMLTQQKWAPVDVDALSDAMIGNAEDGFMSLEVLEVVDDTTEEDDAKTTTTKEKTTTTTSGRTPGKKKDEKDANQSLKKGALMEEERCCFNAAAVASPYTCDGVLSKKDARILKRKRDGRPRWKRRRRGRRH